MDWWGLVSFSLLKICQTKCGWAGGGTILAESRVERITRVHFINEDCEQESLLDPADWHSSFSSPGQVDQAVQSALFYGIKYDLCHQHHKLQEMHNSFLPKRIRNPDIHQHVCRGKIPMLQSPSLTFELHFFSLLTWSNLVSEVMWRKTKGLQKVCHLLIGASLFFFLLHTSTYTVIFVLWCCKLDVFGKTKIIYHIK